MKWSNAECGYSIADRVEGQHSAGDPGGLGHELLLPEADSQRLQCRAAKPGQAKRDDAQQGSVPQKGSDQHEGSGKHEGQEVVGNPAGKPFRNGRREDAAGGNNTLERGKCQ